MNNLARKTDTAPQELPLEIIAETLWMHAEHYSEAAQAVLDGLTAAGYTINRATAPAPLQEPARKPARRKAPRPIAEIYAPNTGDPALDKFMRKHHNPKWKPAPLPRLRKPSRLSAARYAALEAEWESMCDTARKDIAAGRKSRAEILLHEVVKLHTV